VLLLLAAIAPLGSLSGCVGLAGSQSANSQPSPLSSIQITPGNVDFGSISTGSRIAQNASVTNIGKTPVVVAQAFSSSQQFTTSGLSLPLTLGAGQTAPFQIWFNGTTAGKAWGRFTLTSNNGNKSVSVSLTGSVSTPKLSLSSSSVSFSNVAPGTTASSTVTLSNAGSVALKISSLSVSGPGFATADMTVSSTLNPGQSASLTVVFAPKASGNYSGTITILSDDPSSPTNIALSGSSSTAPVGQLALSASSLSFGSIVDGLFKSLPVTLSNTGNASLTIAQATLAGAGYSVSGLSTPLTIAPGASSNFSVTFAPTTAGGLPGSLSMVSDASNSTASIALSGTGVAGTFTMSASPAALAFGSIGVGGTTSQSVSISNTGNSAITISQVTASGAGVSVGGLGLPATLSPSQSASMNVTFTPASAGAVSGGISVMNAQGGTTTVSVSGTGVQPGLSVTPGSVSFGNVSTTTTNSQTIQIQNTGSASLTISQATITGAGYSVTGLTLPATLAAGQSSTFNVQFSPTVAGSVAGSLSIVSNAPNSPAVIPLSGTGVASTYTLTVSPASLNFGNVTTGTAASQNVTISNSGNASITITQITATGTGYALGGGSSVPVTLAPSQSMTFGVQFSPAVAGSANGSITIVSNATNSPVLALSGSGVAPAVQHTVALSWNASTSTVVGYNVYRSTVSGGPYTKINASPVSPLTFTDTTVQHATTYYYVTTAVDSTGAESVYSNEVAVSIP
jgi:hypothetical protein